MRILTISFFIFLVFFIFPLQIKAISHINDQILSIDSKTGSAPIKLNNGIAEIFLSSIQVSKDSIIDDFSIIFSSKEEYLNFAYFYICKISGINEVTISYKGKNENWITIATLDPSRINNIISKDIPQKTSSNITYIKIDFHSVNSSIYLNGNIHIGFNTTNVEPSDSQNIIINTSILYTLNGSSHSFSSKSEFPLDKKNTKLFTHKILFFIFFILFISTTIYFYITMRKNIVVHSKYY